MSGTTTSQLATLLPRRTKRGSPWRFLVLLAHHYTLPKEYVCEGTFVAKLAVSLDEPSAGFLLSPPRFDAIVREGT